MYEHNVFDIIKTLMERDHITQKELAEKTKISASTISSMLSRQSRTIQIGKLQKIAEVFHLSWYDLTGRYQNLPEGDNIDEIKIPTELGEDTARRVLQKLMGPEWQPAVPIMPDPTSLLEFYRNNITTMLDKLNEAGMIKAFHDIFNLINQPEYTQNPTKTTTSNKEE